MNRLSKIGNVEDIDDEQLENIDAVFNEMLSTRQIRPEGLALEKSPLRFDKSDLEKIKKEFTNVCDGEYMTFEQFRTSLGLLGSEDFFAKRLFLLIDTNSDDKISVEEYWHYLDTLINGTTAERSLFGWRMIAGNRNFIQLHDLYQLFYDIAMLWKTITGEVINLSPGYLEQVFNFFDIDEDQAITFDDYQILFEEEPLIFGWHQFLNGHQMGEEDLRKGFNKGKTALQLRRKSTNTNVRQDSYEESALKRFQKQEVMKKRFLGVCDKLKELASTARQDQTGEGSTESKLQLSPLFDLSFKSDHTFLSKPYDTAIVLRPETMEDKQQQEEFSQLIPSSNVVKSLRSKMILSTEGDTAGKICNQLKILLDKVSILQSACRNLSDMQEQERVNEKRRKQLKFKYQYVSKQLSIQGSKPQNNKSSVYFGHQSWNLVLNLMIGLRRSIKALHQLNHQLDIKDSFFDQKYEFMLTNKLKKPACQYFKFSDFAPLVFEKLRFSFGISNEAYQRSIGPENFIGKMVIGHLMALSEKCSTGKSGSFFYQTHDNKYLLKTIPKKEFLFLKSILKKYYEHMIKHQNSLIVRICGVYKIKRFFNKSEDKAIYFICMENVFSAELKIIEKFDLKGSSYGRSGSQGGDELKDNDWMQKNRKIELNKEERDLFSKQIMADSQFFSNNNINDYSFLLGIAELPNKDVTTFYDPNRPFFRRYRGGCLSKNEDKVYIFSIIDIFTEFNVGKNMESIFKRAFLGKGVSCIPPSQYSQRFATFILQSLS